MRVINGNARPGDPFWRFVDAALSQSGETEVEFFGPISEYSWYGDEVTPKTFKDELNSRGKGGPVTLKVNSPGGEVFAAAAIRNIIRDYPGKVTADIIGLAASAATVVVSAADHVKMRDTAMFMIHDPSTIAWGTLDDMRQVVTVLEQVKETILNGYQARTGMERATLSEMMSAETWMTASEAQGYGFVDEVVVDQPKDAKLPKGVKAAFLNCLGGYRNMPEAVIEQMAEEEAADAPEGEQAEVIPAAEEDSTSAADNEHAQAIEDLRERVKAIIAGGGL